MLNGFSADYSERSDDDLLLLASDRASLTTEAATALDAELRRRHLPESDQMKHQQFVKRIAQREAKQKRRNILGARRDRDEWLDVIWAVLAMVLISCTYLALPGRYHMRPDWEEAALHTMFASIFIVVGGRPWWRKIGFWMSLILSSAIDLFVIRAWIHLVGNLSRWTGKVAILLGFVLFFAVYGFVELLRRNLYGTEARDEA
jgi:hypothetical protein